jgi:hypothetical protein
MHSLQGVVNDIADLLNNPNRKMNKALKSEPQALEKIIKAMSGRAGHSPALTYAAELSKQ